MFAFFHGFILNLTTHVNIVCITLDAVCVEETGSFLLIDKILDVSTPSVPEDDFSPFDNDFFVNKTCTRD